MHRLEELLLEGGDLVRLLLRVDASVLDNYFLRLLLHLTLQIAARPCFKHYGVARRLVRVRLGHVASELLVQGEAGLAHLALVGERLD